ncbi:DUF1501 domain-containing protein [Frigoriglobus tundricola]|uniref:Uncharacterized DUF1501 protein, type 2 n=1 Tax=Frigoriglobus tundricola TaxID=2774151 RepID=A0A6M5YGY5_9BACT|nr:DUF1501 domain-containing protein [Frigoriglobus tundricola]QJW92621.1 Uncharacterized DUF1501 protein, type 2 [Frigoriglobus tundricola]
MFQLDLGSSGRYCDGLNRRSFLKMGVAGMAAVGVPELLRAKDAGTATSKDTSVILIWLDGGPGHMDMYDMKPDAPAEYRGIWKPTRTKVPGFDVTELFPRQAKVTDKFSVVRSLYHNTGDHFAGGHRMLTAKDMGVSGASTGQRFPGIGAIVNREIGPRKPGVPGYTASPHAASIGLAPGYFGGHMLGVQHDPFVTGDPNAPNFQVRNLNLAAGLTLEKLDDRKELLNHFDRQRAHLDTHPTARAMDRFSREAFEFVAGPTARKAFDIGQEPVRLRDSYGRDNWGQSTLLARRLVEAGSTFVTVHFGGWDHHWDLKAGYENYLPKVDRAVSALFTDLDDRGLLETTLVVLCGEFSRTPKMNDGGNGGAPMSMGTPGRDHWGNAMFCLMGGGGVRGGRVIGSTDRLGTAPHTRAVTPSNIHATIYKVLGIDPKLQLLDPSGRPVSVLDDPEPIHELF